MIRFSSVVVTLPLAQQIHKARRIGVPENFDSGHIHCYHVASQRALNFPCRLRNTPGGGVHSQRFSASLANRQQWVYNSCKHRCKFCLACLPTTALMIKGSLKGCHNLAQLLYALCNLQGCSESSAAYVLSAHTISTSISACGQASN